MRETRTQINLVGKHERQIIFKKPRSKREDNIKVDFREMRRRTWIGFIWLRRGDMA